MATSITAAMLYDMVACPHRVTMDVHGDASSRDPADPVLALLWSRGAAHERDVVAALGTPVTDLSDLSGAARERATLEAMAAQAPLIYGGCVRDEDLLATPTLLRLDDDGYVAGDVRSGCADDAAEAARMPRRSYAMQLALYTDVLERRDLSAGRYGFVVDGHGEEVLYELDAPRGPRTALTLWQEYLKLLARTRDVVARADTTRPAHAPACRLCTWRSACIERLERDDDLSLLPEVARSTRDALAPLFPTVGALAKASRDGLADQARRVEGVGGAMLQRLSERARLARARAPSPYRRAEIELPDCALEVFLHVDVDPLRDHCYLHGFLERAPGKKARYHGMFAADASEEAEEKAFAEAWAHLEKAGDFALYHYGTCGRAAWRALQERYPQVCDVDDIEALFAADTTVDLYASVVRPRTEWPTRDYSARSIATYLGFEWRANDGAAIGTVDLYERWLEGRDAALKKRMLTCNEDDCRATACVLDAVRELEPRDED